MKAIIFYTSALDDTDPKTIELKNILCTIAQIYDFAHSVSDHVTDYVTTIAENIDDLVIYVPNEEEE